jgi:general secretion pathway protein C
MRQQLGEASVLNSAVGAEKAVVADAGNGNSGAKDYSAIVEQNIFRGLGAALSPAEALQVDDSASQVLPGQEELNIALLGTIAGSPQISRAIIEDLKTNAISLYKIGDAVATARIESIEKDLVVLIHNGQRKILDMQTRESGARGIDKAHEVLPNNAVQTHKTTSVPIASSTQLEEVEALLKSAVIEPYVVDDRVEGLRMTGLENIPQGKNLGLKNGDVIRTVNGHLLSSKQQTYQIFRKARSQPTLSIELMRGNKTRMLSFPVK